MTEVRLDKWLWAARWYKTRAVAARAVAGGHVEVNGNRAKPARTVRVGDALRIRKGPYTYDITVLDLLKNRGPATAASGLYRESDTSIRERNRLALELKTPRAKALYDPGKPSNRDRRQARSLKRGEQG